MKTLCLPAVALLVLSGCSSTPSMRSGCDPDQAAQEAVANGVIRRGLEELYPHCDADALDRAYTEAVQNYCLPDSGWIAGREGVEPKVLCEAQAGRAWNEAYRLGSQLKEFTERRAALTKDIARLAESGDSDDQAELRQLRIQHQQFTREIEQIRGIGQIRGWSAAPVPD